MADIDTTALDSDSDKIKLARPALLATVQRVNDFANLTDESKGSAMLGHLPAGTGATGRTVQSKLREYISVTDYADLVFTHTAKSPGDPASHVSSSFESWKLAIQAALDEAEARGGCTVLIPGRDTTYLIDDYLTVGANTRVVFEGEVQLGDYTAIGGILILSGDNIELVNPRINCSGIYAGASGENGICPLSGDNIKIFGGKVRNCARGNVGGKFGGKAFQNEGYDSGHIVVDGTSIEGCFMAISCQHNFSESDPRDPMIFTNIIAEDCEMLLFVRQVNGTSTDGQSHTVLLSNFAARNCGSHEGVFQFSRAANVLVSNGIVTNSASVEALIRGNHRYCTFDNIQFIGNCDALIDLDASEYALDSSYPLTNNNYEIHHTGTAGYVAWANVATLNRVLVDSTIKAHLSTDVTTKIVGDELRNAYCRLELQQGGKTIITNTATLYLESKTTFASFGSGVSIPRVNTGQITFPASQVASTDVNTLDDYEENATASPITLTDGSGAGLSLTTAYADVTKIGRMVFVSFRVTYPATGSGVTASISGLPVAAANNSGRVSSGLALRFTDYAAAVGATLNPGASTFGFCSLAGGGLLTNANLSGKTVDGMLIYMSAS